MSAEFPDTQWLTIPDLVEVLGQSQSQVRRLVEDNALAAVRIDGILKVPAVFISEGEPVHELKGTIVLLRDCGFNDDELVDWLLSDEESLGTTPIQALLVGRKTEVRRIAQALL